MSFAHIINPFKAAAGSEHQLAQPITFESLRVAQQFALPGLKAELYAICYAEESAVIPSFFNRLPPLSRSVLDHSKFALARKYPLVGDVLKALFENSGAEYLIFSNMDIALMPQFYLAVKSLIEQGYDALLINRRGISSAYKDVKDLPLMYSDYGMPHPGFDCFVFHREIFPQLILENICIGVPFSEVALTHNLIAFAKNLKLVDDMHLTFHIGTEVMPPVDPDYYNYNRREYETKIYPRLKPLLNIQKFPYAQLPFHKRLLKWMLNPSFRTHQVLEMEGKSFWRRLKYRVDAERFKLLGRK
jgi:hypothetical protein